MTIIEFLLRLEARFTSFLVCSFGAKSGGADAACERLYEQTYKLWESATPNYQGKNTQTGTSWNVNRTKPSLKATSRFLSDPKPVLPPSFYSLFCKFSAPLCFLGLVMAKYWLLPKNLLSQDFQYVLADAKGSSLHVSIRLLIQFEWKLQAFRDSSSAS